MTPLNIPLATVMLNASIAATNKMPAMMTPKSIATNTAGQCLCQGKQCELPRERLRSWQQAPHKIPVQLYAHCASAPLGRLRLILTFAVEVWQ